MRSDPTELKSESLDADCERAQLLITRHIDGEAGPGDAQALRRHIDGCARCRKMLESQTRQSHRVAVALQTLWPSEAKPVSALARFRGAVLRTASLLVILLVLILLAQRTYAPTPARPHLPAAQVPDAEKEKPKVAEIEGQ